MGRQRSGEVVVINGLLVGVDRKGFTTWPISIFGSSFRFV